MKGTYSIINLLSNDSYTFLKNVLITVIIVNHLYLFIL